MGTYRIPAPLSEVHGLPPYTHCVACSMIVGLNGLHPGLAPSSYLEADALYRAAGPLPGGGESVEAVLAAARHRYGLTRPITVIGHDGAAVWDALVPGHAAVAIGRPANLPTSSVLRLWVGLKFAGQHCDYFMRLDNREALWLIDPCHPGSSSYHGNLVSKAAFLDFYEGSAAILGIDRL